MKVYAAMNDRADGTKNLLVLNGKDGYAGKTKVYVKYNSDASISISGEADEISYKLLAEPCLEIGNYLFLGFSGIKANSLGLYLVSAECGSKSTFSSEETFAVFH